jgi:hypothetical protein
MALEFALKITKIAVKTLSRIVPALATLAQTQALG